MKKVFVLTGKRGGYGAMKPMLKLFEKSKKYDLKLIVTDQHLDKKFGNTVNEIKKDFENLIEIPLFQKKDDPFSRVSAMSVIIEKLSQVFYQMKPDYLFLYGDRSEVLAAALAAIHFDLIIIHIQGGDVSGNIDDSIRNSVSKLAHIHLVSNKQSYQNLVNMGEKKNRIFIVGDNHIDPIVNKNYKDKLSIKNKYKLNKKLVLFLFHPETLNRQKNYLELEKMLYFLLSLDITLIAIYPCSDPGYEKIVRILQKFRGYKNFKLFKNLESPEFLGLMNVSSLLIGNSSCGIIEAPYFSLNVINLGERQRNRLRSNNVIDLDYDIENFKKTVLKILNKKKEKFKKPYGNGKTAKNVIDTITKINKNYKNFLKKH
tara:strand:+ start:3611 stop:4726 length:1116 start_codon:yes stop_codon:yes gene_type:complete